MREWSVSLTLVIRNKQVLIFIRRFDRGFDSLSFRSSNHDPNDNTKILLQLDRDCVVIESLSQIKATESVSLSLRMLWLIKTLYT